MKPPRHVGSSVPRIEDPLLVTGGAEFIDNVEPPGCLHCAILRSPHPHARIVRVDRSAAAALEGVVAVVTGADAQRLAAPAATVPNGWGTLCLAVDRVRFVGEPVAAVAASSRAIAEDAIERIVVEYEELPVVMDPRRAASAESPRLFADKDTNVVYRRVFEWGDVAGAFRDADRVLTGSFRFHRAGANALENFGVIAQWNVDDGSLTCHGSFQAPAHIALGRLASLRLAPERLRLVPHRTAAASAEERRRGTDIAALLCASVAGGQSSGSRTGWSTAGAASMDRRYDASIAVRRDGTSRAFRSRCSTTRR